MVDTADRELTGVTRLFYQSWRKEVLTAITDSVPIRSTPGATLIDAARWDAFLAQHEDASFEQSATFGACLCGKERTSFLAVKRNDKLIGGACVATFAVPALGGLAYVKYGPLWRRRDEVAAPEHYRAVLSALIGEYVERRGYGLIVVPRPHPTVYSIEAAMLAERGFAVRRLPADPNRFLVDVTLDECAQWDSLEQKWRYNLRAALKNGIDIAEAVDATDIEAFFALHAAMLARKRFAARDPVDLVPALATGLPPRLRPRVFLARRQGRPVAGAVIGLQGDTAYYLFGASNDDALPLKAGYALQWWVVRWLRDQAVDWYDLGGEAGEVGLRQFKKGLAGRRGAIVQTHGEYEYTRGFNARLATEVVLRARGAWRALRRQLARAS